jgi:hypothetical protein
MIHYCNDNIPHKHYYEGFELCSIMDISRRQFNDWYTQWVPDKERRVNNFHWYVLFSYAIYLEEKEKTKLILTIVE